MKELPPFDSVRERLERQYELAVYEPESGLGKAELEAEFADHCRAHPDEPRVLTRAWLMHLIFTKGRIAPERDNYFAGKVDSCNLPEENRWRWVEEAWAGEFGDSVPGVNWVTEVTAEHGVAYMIDYSHVCPDWPAILALGLPGLRERARRGGDTPFHRACVLVLDGAMALCRRLGTASDNPALSALAERPPETLHEAFQLAYFYHDLVELEGESVRTMGWFDRHFLEFYRADLASGRLTRDRAKELIKYFWIAFFAKTGGKAYGKNFCFGPELNELSYLGMEVYHEMHTPDPKLTVRVDPEKTPDRFLEAVARNIRDGRTGIALLNDPVVIAGLVKHGRSPEDAVNYVPVGCYEPAVLGHELSCSGAGLIYLPHLVRLLLGRRCDFGSFGEVLDAYLKVLRDEISYQARQQSRCEKLWPMTNPSPLLSAGFGDCVASGRDVSEGGVRYNTSGCLIGYLADAVDSLAAIDWLVFREKRCTLAELWQAVEADWKGREKLQLLALNRAPKWGNNDPAADDIAVAITACAGPWMNRRPNGRGGTMFAAVFGQMVVEYGRRVGALPSGRNAGAPLSKNLCACVGMDRNGVTALIDSATKIDLTDYPDGACLDLMLHPSAVAGDEGVDTIVALMRTFLDKGGSGLQFNIFDAATLRDAQRRPEVYRTLQVRVCGWNVRFVDLAPEAQETFIAQAEAVS